MSSDRVLSAASLTGGLSIVAPSRVFVSRIDRIADETPLPRLHQCSREIRARDVELGRHRAIQLDPTLTDQAPRLTGRQAEGRREQRGQVNRVSVRQDALGNVRRGTAFADDARD